MRNRGIAVAFVVLAALPGTIRAQTPNDLKALKSAEKHYKPVTKTDAFTKSVNTYLELENVEYIGNKEMECGSGFVHLAVLHMVDPKDGASTFLQFVYSSRDWIFIPATAQLQVLVGDSIRTFAPLGDPSRDVSYGMAHEDQEFTLTSADLAWLATQPNVRARVQGEKGTCDFPIKSEALALMGLFNDRVVLGSSASTASR